MIIAQSVPLGIDRGSPRLFTIEITGIDLTNADLHAQIRLSPDAPGDPVVDLPKVTSGTVAGVRLVAVDNSGTLPISWIRLQIPAMATGTGGGQLPPAAELGDDVTLYWDMIVTPAGFTADRWFFGPVTVRASVTNTGTLAPLVDDPLPGADAVAKLIGADLSVTLAGAALIEPLVTRADGSAASAVAAAAHAETKAQVATDAANTAIQQVGLALPKAGGQMTGPIDMNGQPVRGVPNPDNDSAATNRGFVNTAISSVYNALSNYAASVSLALAAKLSLTGGNLTGVLNMGLNRIEAVADPDSDDDAAHAGFVKAQVAVLASPNGAALVDESNLKGSFRTVSDLASRNAIAANRRQSGMRVKVLGDDGTGVTGRDFVLGPDLTTWSSLLTHQELLAAPAAARTTEISNGSVPVFMDEAIRGAVAVDGSKRVLLGVDLGGSLIAPPIAPAPATPLTAYMPVFPDEYVYAASTDSAGGIIVGVNAAVRLIAPGVSYQVAPMFSDDLWLTATVASDFSVISGIKRDGTPYPSSASIGPVTASSTAPIFSDEVWLTSTIAPDLSVITGVKRDGTSYPAPALYPGWTSYVDGSGAVALLNGSKGFRVAKPVGTVRGLPSIAATGLVTWADDQGGALPEYRQISLGGAKVVPSSVSRMVMIFMLGQSLGIGSGGYPAVTRAPVRLGRAFSFNGGTRVLQPDPTYGTWEQGSGNSNHGELRSLLDQQIVSLIDLYEHDDPTGAVANWYGETSVSGAAWWLTANTPANIGFLGGTLAIGGASLSQQMPGSPMYKNLIRAVERAKAFCDLMGIALEVPAILWVQGEADRATDPATYRANWRVLQAALTTDINAITGGTGQVVIVFDQNASWSVYQPLGTLAAAQLAEAIANPTKFQPVMPEYTLIYKTDGIHADPPSYRKRGEYEGRVLGAVRAAQQAGTALTATSSGALYFTGAIVSGTNLTLSTTAASQLVIDTALVTDPGQYGLRIYDSSGAEIALSNIAVSGTSQLVATLAAPLTAGTSYWLGVADKSVTGTKAGATTGPRCCLRDSSTDTGSDGANLYHWAFVQQLQIQ